MKSIIAAMAILALCGCEPATPERVEAIKARYPFTGVEAYHDDVRSVTCWTTSRGGLSCMPDWMIARKESAQ